MALISCPECSKEVSDSAPSCPNCGVAIASKAESRAAGASLTTVQETSKKLKLHTLGSVAAVVIGVVWLMAQMNAGEGGGEPGAVPILLIVGGLGWYFVTRFRIWWHHK
ncbi:zinc ribbon domain-containing protein [Thioalkalivibrio sp. ALE12]|uniref:zinc ribbon domain-containing protein n=1 Tax=Thioalkalivibrio sp. ALE12 TaxID=1158170 RepID=UPI0009DB08B8